MASTRQAKLIIDDRYVDFLKLQLDSSDPSRTKKALQDLCKLYREGRRIAPARLFGVEQSIVGSLYTLGKHEKVRRWALNSLARLGHEQNSLAAILHTLQKYGDDPQTAASAIAAVYKLSKKAAELLAKLNLDPTLAALAALQHVDAKSLDLSPLPLNIERASPDLLKLALLLVGLNRSPPNMLNPRHSNAKMVKVLGGHDDLIVSQYSVWAIAENSELGFRDLGIDIRDVERAAPNVRGWIFQLLATTADEARKRLDLLKVGIEDIETECRLGLARGLRKTYFDGLEPLVLDWYMSEIDPEVSPYILDHMAVHAPQCLSYEQLVVEVYEKEPAHSVIRLRLEAAAAGTALFAKLQRISYDGGSDLFGGVGTMINKVTNNTFNISGPVQGGAVAIGGSATNKGDTSNQYSQEQVLAVQSELSRIEQHLHGSGAGIDEALRQEALKKIGDAKSDPTPTKVRGVFDTLKQIGQTAKSALDVAASYGPLAEGLGKLLLG